MYITTGYSQHCSNGIHDPVYKVAQQKFPLFKGIFAGLFFAQAHGWQQHFTVDSVAVATIIKAKLMQYLNTHTKTKVSRKIISLKAAIVFPSSKTKKKTRMAIGPLLLILAATSLALFGSAASAPTSQCRLVIPPSTAPTPPACQHISNPEEMRLKAQCEQMFQVVSRNMLEVDRTASCHPDFITLSEVSLNIIRSTGVKHALLISPAPILSSMSGRSM